ncbi:hypothetical protein B7P43_G12126, partial [Cryptotermes secundus]
MEGATEISTKRTTEMPTGRTSQILTVRPVVEISTKWPIELRTERSTGIPTEKPTRLPTEILTQIPTESPIVRPTERLTEVPTEGATEISTEKLTEIPTIQPTEITAEGPTGIPTERTSRILSEAQIPTKRPTEIPTEGATVISTERITGMPTERSTEILTEGLTEITTVGLTKIMTRLTETEAPVQPEKYATTTEGPTEITAEQGGIYTVGSTLMSSTEMQLITGTPEEVITVTGIQTELPSEEKTKVPSTVGTTESLTVYPTQGETELPILSTTKISELLPTTGTTESPAVSHTEGTAEVSTTTIFEGTTEVLMQTSFTAKTPIGRTVEPVTETFPATTLGQITHTDITVTTVSPSTIIFHPTTKLTNRTCVADADCPPSEACRCSQCVNPCAESNNGCAHNALCTVLNHIIVCTCPPGQFGDATKDCQETPGTTKAPVPCESDMDCVDTEACYKSFCLDPCEFTNACASTAKCHTKAHRPICTCPSGYEGNPAVKCSPTQPLSCSSNDDCPLTEACFGGVCQHPCDVHDPCAFNAVCINTNHGTDCSCAEGYQGNGFVGCGPVKSPLPICHYNEDCPPHKLCDRLNRVCINPCLEDSCGENAQCLAVNHGIDCKCLDGYIGNPYVECMKVTGCHNDDECHTTEACISG